MKIKGEHPSWKVRECSYDCPIHTKYSFAKTFTFFVSHPIERVNVDEAKIKAGTLLAKLGEISTILTL